MSKETCICSSCKRTFVPSFFFDFYPQPTPEDPNAGLCETCMLGRSFLKDSGAVIDPEPISGERGRTICKQGQGEATCAFLGMGTKGLVCFKGSRMESAIMEQLEKGTMCAKGDNCSGPPDFKQKDRPQSA